MPESQVRAVVYDTDVVSRSFKGRLPEALAARLVGKQPMVTFVTVGELTQWTTLRRWGPRNAVGGRRFSQMLAEALNRYQNRIIDAAQVIAEIVELTESPTRRG